MIFYWFKPQKHDLYEQKTVLEYSEKPVYNTEDSKMSDLIAEILSRLDEIDKLFLEIEESKENK